MTTSCELRLVVHLLNKIEPGLVQLILAYVTVNNVWISQGKGIISRQASVWHCNSAIWLEVLLSNHRQGQLLRTAFVLDGLRQNIEYEVPFASELFAEFYDETYSSFVNVYVAQACNNLKSSCDSFKRCSELVSIIVDKNESVFTKHIAAITLLTYARLLPFEGIAERPKNKDEQILVDCECGCKRKAGSTIMWKVASCRYLIALLNALLNFAPGKDKIDIYALIVITWQSLKTIRLTIPNSIDTDEELQDLDDYGQHILNNSHGSKIFWGPKGFVWYNPQAWHHNIFLEFDNINNVSCGFLEFWKRSYPLLRELRHARLHVDFIVSRMHGQFTRICKAYYQHCTMVKMKQKIRHRGLFTIAQSGRKKRLLYPNQREFNAIKEAYFGFNKWDGVSHCLVKASQIAQKIALDQFWNKWNHKIRHVEKADSISYRNKGVFAVLLCGQRRDVPLEILICILQFCKRADFFVQSINAI